MSRKFPFNFNVVANADTEAPAEISIRGVIGKYFDPESYSVSDTEEDVLNELNKIPAGKKINLRINSPGGAVGIALGCYNAFSRRAADVTTYNDGYACSMASVLMLAGARRVSPKSSLMMIHRASAQCEGNDEDMTAAATMLAKHNQMMAELYTKASGVGTPESWLEKMKAETWFTGSEAKAAGLTTDDDGEIEQAMGDNEDPEAKRIVASFKRAPKDLRSRFEVTAQAKVIPPMPPKTTPPQKMKKVIDALVAAGFTVQPEATEDQIALCISRDVAPLRAEVQKHIDARKSRITALLDAAVTGKVITEARRGGLLAFGVASAEGEAEVSAISALD